MDGGLGNNDRVYGEAGNDAMEGGSGVGDYCSGSSGNDTAGMTCEITAGVP
jgi:hypothetical protein